MFQYFKFRLNDKVFMEEYRVHIYRIVGYRLERNFFPQDDWTTAIYELYREVDGFVTEAEEDELISVRSSREEFMDMNALLDKYNDYRFLADYFHDNEYHRKCAEVLEEMKNITA